MFIDIHVHARDGKQAYKETIEHILSVAYRVGMSAIASVGNGDPATIDEEAFLYYQDKAVKVNSSVEFFQWILLTPQTKQIEKAIELWYKYKEAIGFKMFAGHSVGETKVDKRKDQRKVFEILAKENYKGVLMTHCEKEDFIVKDFNPNNPISHCCNRPPIAEIASVSDMLGDALENRYQGRLHIAHASCPESVEMCHRHLLKEKLSVGVGPQHLLMHEGLMKEFNGIYRKKNPPLRDENRMLSMQKKLFNNELDFYESDHAPHIKKEKLNPPYFSGFPQLPIFPLFLRWLKKYLNNEQIKKFTFGNTKKIFSPKLDNVKPRTDVSLDKLEDLIKEVPQLRKEYDYDAWEGIL